MKFIQMATKDTFRRKLLNFILAFCFHGFALTSCIILLSLSLAADDEVPFTVVNQPWDIHYGHHRALIRVTQSAEAVRVHLPWRRRDHDAARKQIILVDSKTGQQLQNLVRAEVNREFADLIFQPATVPGEYEAYYLPYAVQMSYGGYGGDYLPPEKSADADWVHRNHLSVEELKSGNWRDLPAADVLKFQARTEFDSFSPMEIVATAKEMKRFAASHSGQPYLLFPEDRKFPIRMTDDLPKCWIDRGSSSVFSGEACRNEFYVWQLGIFASKQPLEGLQLEFSDLTPTGGGKPIAAAAQRCFNFGGIDAYGKPFVKNVMVQQGKVQALWIGVDVARDAAPGEYRGAVVLRSKNAPSQEVTFTLRVDKRVLEDRGDSELWRCSRLRWLDSTLGEDDEIIAPYTPLEAEKNEIRCLGHTVTLGDDGLPKRIRSVNQEILAAPLRFVVEDETGASVFTTASSNGEPRFTKRTPGVVAWESALTSQSLAMNCRGEMEFDGHLSFSVTLKADRAMQVKDIRLEIPFEPAAATYMMGAGLPGQYRPREYSWKWAGPQDSFWIGDVHAGLHCELRGGSYHGPMLNLYHPAPPPAWHNSGNGGVTIAEQDATTVLARAYSGPRNLAAGESITFEFALLITPVKPLDPTKHFRERYYHNFPPPSPDVLAAAKVNVINVHHANEANPYINYPFAAVRPMSEFVERWQQQGMKVKIYYTVRELSNYVQEMWALRSLDAEVLASGPGGGFPWLREHLEKNYQPSWFQPYPNGTADASIVTSGESRWYNYYVEGLQWLVQNVKIDGLYLDDVTYDRRILKRMRKVLERSRPGCLIDLHSNTGFSIGPANQYAEFFPYVDRLWFGESFQYNTMPPDNWLVEVSGIPFGLMGDMLQGGGNPWRGMVYGMTNRLPWDTEGVRCDPRDIWKVWDDFGIADAKMIGYWEKDCPVRTDRKEILATAYVKEGKTLVALASWAPQMAECQLKIDWKAIGLNPAKVKCFSPEIRNFQSVRTWKVDEGISVESSKGWIIVIE